MKKSFLFLLMAIILSISGWSQTTITVGTQGSENWHFIPGLYGFHTSVSLFTASELSSLPLGSTIESASFMATKDFSSTGTMKIYLYEADAITGTIGDAENAATLVYNGTIGDFTKDAWTVIGFTTPYIYQGGNLILIIDAASSVTGGDGAKHIYDNGTAGSGYCKSQDANPVDNSMSITSMPSQDVNRPYIQLTYTGGSTCLSPSTLTASDLTASGATLTWAAVDGASSYIYQYKTTDADWNENNEVTISSTSVTLTGLSANTAYDFRVRANCGSSNESSNKSTSFRTECDVISTLPWSENFENTTTGLPDCWDKISANTYPSVSTSSVHAGSEDLKFNCNLGTSHFAVLPEFSNTLGNLQLSFWSKP